MSHPLKHYVRQPIDFAPQYSSRLGAGHTHSLAAGDVVAVDMELRREERSRSDCSTRGRQDGVAGSAGVERL